MTSTYHPGVHRFSVFVVCWTVLLFVAGALVTSKDAALSVTDWPKSHGTWVPPLTMLQGGDLFEFSHRVVAGGLGFLTLALAVLLWVKEKRPWLRWLGLIAVLGVAVQAILGGQVVIRRLPPQGNSDLAAHGGCLAGARNGYLDGGRAAQTISTIAEILQGAHPAACNFWNAVPAGSWGLLVAAHDRGCSAADACHGNVNGDPYGRGGDSLRIFGVASADVLQVDSARKGSCRHGATAGDHGMSTARTTELTFSARANGYVSLTKPDVSFLVLMTTAAGYYMGARGPVEWLHMIHAVFGTMLIAAGTAALNHYIERESDRYMRRTALRPLPSGVLQPREALVFGVVLAIAGAVDLYVAAGALASGLGVVTCLCYLLAYTPLKKRTVWATFVGAFPGAIPPMIGWVAATGSLDRGAWLLFGILFLWQFPHFHAIAWMYRQDYARAGIMMLPVVDREGTRTFRQIILYAVALVGVSLLPAILGLAGVKYFFGALVTSTALVQVCLWASSNKTNARAKWLMHATVLHIPLLLGLMVYDKLPH